MDFDDLLFRYFGSRSLDGLSSEQRDGGVEKMLVDLGLARDSGQRFALWAVLYMLGEAPDLDVAFKDPADRDAARNFMDLMARAEDS